MLFNFWKHKAEVCLKERFKKKVGDLSTSQKDVTSLRDSMKEKLINVGAMQYGRFNTKLR